MSAHAPRPPSTICSVTDEAKDLPDWPREKIVSWLEAIIRNTPEDMLRIISNADGHAFSGDDEKHYAALKELIEVNNCRIDWGGNVSWFPMEPIELVAHSFAPNYEHAFATCTAILMIEDIEGGFADYTEFRWLNLGPKTYNKLTPEFREPILAGFGFLIRRGDFERSGLSEFM